MKKKKKWREIRSAVTMMLVMVAMLSTATYAWFSLTSNPVVNGLEMTAVASDGLWISKDGTSWFNAIDMNEFNTEDNVAALDSFVLQPVTLVSTDVNNGCLTFNLPKYEGNKVVGSNGTVTDNTSDPDTLKEFNGYVASCTYFLKSTGSGEVNVGIITKDPAGLTSSDLGVTELNNAITEGSFVIETDTSAADSGDHSAVEAVRIAFVVGDTVKIWEPNWTDPDTVLAGSTHAVNAYGTPATSANVVSGQDDGKITTGYKSASGDMTSEALFTVGTEKTAVKMYIWFEGQDPHCVDQIIKDVIEAQIQFTVVSNVEATP